MKEKKPKKKKEAALKGACEDTPLLNKSNLNKPKHPGGRPTKYSKELADRICEQISTSIFGLETICSNNPDFPNPSNIFVWLIKYPEFQEKYDKAREHQCNVMADKILQVAWDDARDTIESERGETCNSEWISRSRLKVDSLKWLLTKLQPRKYGEKVQNDTTVTLNTQDDWVKLKPKNDR